MHFFHHSVFSKYMKNTEWYKTVHLKETWKERKRNAKFSSVAQLPLTLCNPMNRSTPGLPVHHQLLESTQTHVHWVRDAIQLSHPLLSPSPPALNLSQHQGLFIFFLYFILFFNFMILYWFCHISTCIHHRYTRVPHPEPSSLPAPHTNPLGLFKWVSSSHQVAKVLEFQLQHQSFQWTPRTDLL